MKNSSFSGQHAIFYLNSFREVAIRDLGVTGSLSCDRWEGCCHGAPRLGEGRHGRAEQFIWRIGGEGGEEGLNWVDVYHLCSDIFFLFCVLRVFVRRFGIHDLLFMFWPKR